jgi:hypothetical protein
MKYAGVGLLFYLILMNRESEAQFLDEHELWQIKDLQKIKVTQNKQNELVATVEGRPLKIKIKNLDTFMQRLEDYGGINVEFDYESLEAQKSNHLGTILELLLLGGIGYWLYLSYGFYKKNVKAGKGLNLGGDMFGFGKIK